MSAPDDDAPSLPLDIEEAGEAFRSGRLTALALTRSLLARAETLDRRLGVYQCRLDESALEEAGRADAELEAGRDRGPLHGIPLGVKDIIATGGAPTAAGSLVFERERGAEWEGRRDAPVVARLREAGAVILGTTSTMEFAIGMPDPGKPFPIARNPWDTDRWAGGSSSGTGAGVAAALMLGGLGSDTGGSIRIPAALCGVSGLKPTYGRVPRSGVVPLAFSLDTVGPIARTARCCGHLLEALAGPDADDPASAEEPLPGYLPAPSGSLARLRIGVDRANCVDRPDVDTELAARFEAAIEELAGAGAEIVPVELPHYEIVRQAGSLSLRAEASAYHLPWLRERWDDYGVHTGKVLVGRAPALVGGLRSGAARACVGEPRGGRDAPARRRRHHADGGRGRAAARRARPSQLRTIADLRRLLERDRLPRDRHPNGHRRGRAPALAPDRRARVR